MKEENYKRVKENYKSTNEEKVKIIHVENKQRIWQIIPSGNLSPFPSPPQSLITPTQRHPPPQTTIPQKRKRYKQRKGFYSVINFILENHITRARRGWPWGLHQGWGGGRGRGGKEVGEERGEGKEPIRRRGEGEMEREEGRGRGREGIRPPHIPGRLITGSLASPLPSLPALPPLSELKEEKSFGLRADSSVGCTSRENNELFAK